MHFDVYLPKEKLALEYQGEQHYKEFIWMRQRDRQERDQEKRIECRRTGITLVEVPFWWDRKRDSLQNSIHLCNKNLIGPIGDGFGIPFDPPENF